MQHLMKNKHSKIILNKANIIKIYPKNEKFAFIIVLFLYWDASLRKNIRIIVTTVFINKLIT